MEFFDKQLDRSQIVTNYSAISYPNGEIVMRPVRSLKTPEGLKDLRQMTLRPNNDMIGLDNITAVCVMLVRR